MFIKAKTLKNSPSDRITGIADMIEHIGRPDFEDPLFSALARQLGADYCLASEITATAPRVLGRTGIKGSFHASARYSRYHSRGCWQFDPLLQIARNRSAGDAPIILHQPRSSIDASAASMIYDNDISDRLAAISVSSGRLVMLVLFRSAASGEFNEDQVRCLSQSGGELLSVVGKHAEFLSHGESMLEAVTSSDIMRENLAASGCRLTARESDVCAALIQGLSIAAISESLSIGSETVVTYRKRAFEKMGISGQRELPRWYLQNWLEQRFGIRFGELMSPPGSGADARVAAAARH